MRITLYVTPVGKTLPWNTGVLYQYPESQLLPAEHLTWVRETLARQEDFTVTTTSSTIVEAIEYLSKNYSTTIRVATWDGSWKRGFDEAYKVLAQPLLRLGLLQEDA